MQTHQRDAGLRRLRRLTVYSGLSAGALVAAFAGLAARALPGKHAASVTNQPLGARTLQQAPVSRIAAPPPLVPLQSPSSSSAPAPAAPSAPPAATSVQPVVVSGGS